MDIRLQHPGSVPGWTGRLCAERPQEEIIACNSDAPAHAARGPNASGVTPTVVVYIMLHHYAKWPPEEIIVCNSDAPGTRGKGPKASGMAPTVVVYIMLHQSAAGRGVPLCHSGAEGLTRPSRL